MSDSNTSEEFCQVDFYLLASASIDASQFACRLAMMARERRQRIFILAASLNAVNQLDELLWQYPKGRFLPHGKADDPDSGKAGIEIGMLCGLKPAEVVINLSPETVPQPEKYRRLLEIVPHAESEKQISRQKYKKYRSLGLSLKTHEISK